MDSERNLLALLGDPDLPARVRGLDGQALAGVVASLGLEDAGLVLELADHAQVRAALDCDVWSAAVAGEAEALDPERFGLWLEVLLDQGGEVAAERMAGMDYDLLRAAVCAAVWVFDADALRRRAQADEDEAEAVEAVLESGEAVEFDHAWVVDRGLRQGHAYLEALRCLNERDSPLFERLMDDCAEGTDSFIEDNGGLYEVLTQAQQALEDAAEARDQRRQSLGFVAPQDAAAFLRHAEAQAPEEALRGPEHDAISRAHLRADEAAVFSADGSARLSLLLQGAAPAKALPQAPQPKGPAEAARAALAALAVSDPAAHAKALRQTLFCANAIVSGLPRGRGRHTPPEALDMALQAIGRGLRHDPLPGGEALARHGALRLFRAGWGKG